MADTQLLRKDENLQLATGKLEEKKLEPPVAFVFSLGLLRVMCLKTKRIIPTPTIKQMQRQGQEPEVAHSRSSGI